MKSGCLTVLIVDDCDEDREIFRRHLEQEALGDYEVLEAETGVEGWELITTQNPDCVLLDYQIPDFDGLEFIEALNKEIGVNRVPVLMLTGQGDEEIAVRAISNGVQDYLIKGKLTAVGLHRAIGHAVERAALLRTTEEQRLAIERSQKELEQFAYVLCHDLQAPVRRIMSFLEMIQKDLKEQLSPQTQSYFDRTIQNAMQMRQLIQDSLDYSLVGGDRKPAETVHLREILNGIACDLEDAMMERRVTLVFGDMPTVMGHPTMLRQLFHNLVGNAIKFQGEQPGTVTISASMEGAMWHFRVEDTGIGMDHECLEKIFNPFSRLHPKSEYPGCGIGLALCKKIVKHHGGRIWAESAKGIGSVFHFTIPSQDADTPVVEGLGERQLSSSVR
ncbi:sensor histidine kinase [Candidatus Nitronereus thalassa]|uniref:histidine kinase n=1 Tax=Candidatus Nitronereus thalassa TaxID=3020898 RepID=A0ABU3K9T4_9BACT|nr:ATP-binding protein [Candidatus Nitronereus thalassa]MDT7043132.1 ATP-binding protein [Candidatus Nitronereus thalassa]